MDRRRFPSLGAAKFVLYHSNFTEVKITWAVQGKPSAEVCKKYFGGIKISTQVLISVWKSPALSTLTSNPSTLFSSLHHLWASFFSYACFRLKTLFRQENNSLRATGRQSEQNFFLFL